MTEAKTAARKAAMARRKTAHAHVPSSSALAALSEVLAPHRGRVLSGYMAIRTEIDPLPVMTDWAAHSPVCLPLVEGRGQPLSFRAWRPDVAMVDGAFGARVPAEGAALVPQVLIVPMLAFDARGYRLGYGGGFYDRTLAKLRGQGAVTAIGLAFSAQRDDDLPLEPTDEQLDVIVTETGMLWTVA